MPTYLTPGVYVEEIASGSAPIVGVGTSTAGFIGCCQDSISIYQLNTLLPLNNIVEITQGDVAVHQKLAKETTITIRQILARKGMKITSEIKTRIEGSLSDPISIEVSRQKQVSSLEIGQKILESIDELQVSVDGEGGYVLTEQDIAKIAHLSPEITGKRILVRDLIDKLSDLNTAMTPLQDVTINEQKTYPSEYVFRPEDIVQIKQAAELLQLTQKIEVYGPQREFSNSEITAGQVLGTAITKPSVQIDANKVLSEIQAEMIRGLPEQQIIINLRYQLQSFSPIKEIKLCTSFTEFKKYFGDFSLDEGQNRLAHAVYGFFRNGGTKCYVGRVTDWSQIDTVLTEFKAIDEIAIVATPGLTDKSLQAKVIAHCDDDDTRDRIAILDSPGQLGSDGFSGNEFDKSETQPQPGDSDYAAYYFPWIKVFDPVTKANSPNSDGLKFVPPSGHIAGVYARVDSQRGVHKAPANEPLVGAVGLKYNVIKTKQENLNKTGINCIRNLNGNILVWGARTLGGDSNGEFKYVNVRRYFCYLRESIDEGTQWTVFEPNTPELWAKIRRNVSAFLTIEWRKGALFGTTPQEAFFVKCDAENNPPEVRDLGQVVTEIGVSVVKPAEFVIFRMSQWAGEK